MDDKPILDQMASIRFKSTMINNLKQIAREKSYKQDKNITWADLVREACEKVYSNWETVNAS